MQSIIRNSSTRHCLMYAALTSLQVILVRVDNFVGKSSVGGTRFLCAFELPV
jgi:hypothetical protein